MTLTAGSISLTSKTAVSAKLAVTAASGSVAPYSNQWYRSLVSGFTPGVGNIISGATGLTLDDSGLVPNTTYYYKVVQTDSDSPVATVTATQLAVVTSQQLQNPNQFAQAPFLGMIAELTESINFPAQIGPAQSGSLLAGCFVKMVDSAGGVPKVVAASADSDDVWGAIIYNIKNASYAAGAVCQVAMEGSFMWLTATAAIARGAQVALDYATSGGVKPISGSGGERIVGRAFDKATVAGQLIRVLIKTPSSSVDA